MTVTEEHALKFLHKLGFNPVRGGPVDFIDPDKKCVWEVKQFNARSLWSNVPLEQELILQRYHNAGFHVEILNINSAGDYMERWTLEENTWTGEVHPC